MAETTTAPAVEKQSIAQKVEALQKSKTDLTSQLNSAPEASKADLQEQINVIDRKLRWYAGRSEGKTKEASPRTPKSKKAKADKPASTPVDVPPPVSTAATES